MPLSAQISMNVLVHESSAGDLSQTLRVTPVSYAASVADGVGTGKAQVSWSDARTLAAASETLSLSALPDVRGGAPATVTLTSVKCWAVLNKGNSPIVLAGSPFPAAGMTVTAGSVNVHSAPAGVAASGVTVTGTIGGAYEILLVGEGSVS